MTDTPDGCRCHECADIHSEFISMFGHWPDLTHEEGQKLKQQRIDNEASFRRVLRP